MSEDETTYCRLCAEPTPEAQLIAADTEVALNSKVTEKMSWINVDVSSSNYLPKTICFSCFDLLEKTWSFLKNVRSAQSKLYSIYANKIKLPPGCEIKPVSRLAESGQPVNQNWEEFQDTKANMKFEIPIKSAEDMDYVKTIDPKTLFEVDLELIKYEPEHIDDSHYNDHESSFLDSDAYGSKSSDSDVPLKMALKHKRSDKKGIKKKKRKIKVKLEGEIIEAADLIPNPNAEAIPLDMSLYNMTWDDYPWRCAKCDTRCNNLTSLRMHSLEIHACCCVFKCADCHKIIANHKSFVNHVRLHNKPLRYCCDLCNKHFPMAQYVKRHRNTTHRDAHITSCQNCGATFETQEQLQDHILMFAKGYRRPTNRKRDKKDSELKCEHCDKEFKSKSNLQAHKLVHTARSRDFSCHVCGKMFFTKGTLGTHMMTHDEVKPFKCDYCPMAFRARGNLISHASLHSGTKPFVCEQCGKSFRVKRHLKSHLIVHTDLMPYSCEYCGKPFRFKTRLNLHLRQHTGAKPYSCGQCHRDFTNGSNYKKHMKRRHNIDTSKKRYPDLVPLMPPEMQNNPFI